MPDTYSISAAARLCGVDRKTLQRAIHAGRLALDAQHQVSRGALLAAGYLVEDAPHPPPQDAPQATPHEAPLVAMLARLARALEALTQELQHQRARGTVAETQATPQETPLRTPQSTPQSTPQPTPQGAYDPTRYVLGRLCPRGHAYGDTGQSVRTLVGRKCRQCEIEQQRERRRVARERRGLG